MDIASIALHFLCAAVAGFLIMSIFGVQALVALCSSISLARRRKHQVPAFDLALALRRIAWRQAIRRSASARSKAGTWCFRRLAREMEEQSATRA